MTRMEVKGVIEDDNAKNIKKNEKKKKKKRKSILEGHCSLPRMGEATITKPYS